MHATSYYRGGIQLWGFANPTGNWQDGETVEFDTGWGDKLEQEINENNLAIG